MKKFLSLCLLATCSWVAMAQQNNASEKPKYTGTDFFNALDLPIVFGGGFTPNDIEGGTFVTTMCLEWRWHKTYSWYVPITIDTHNSNYSDLYLNDLEEGCNIVSGTVWYNEINIGVGYRVPLVKNIRDFYDKPYANALNFFVCLQPGVSNPLLKKIQTSSSLASEALTSPEARSLNYISSDSEFRLVPNLKLTAGVEWFVDPKLCLFLQAAYVQHLTPTLLEKAAIQQQRIKAPSGPIFFSIGLSTFFE